MSFLQRTETSFLGRASNIATGYVVLIIWTTLIMLLYNWLYATYPIFNFPFHLYLSQLFGTPHYKHQFWIDIFESCITAPLWEEAFFRHLPLQVVKASGKKELVAPTILGSAMIFGFLHNGQSSIAIQGIAGLVLGTVYVKNNYSYLSSVILHSLWNFSLIIGMYTFIK